MRDKLVQINQLMDELTAFDRRRIARNSFLISAEELKLRLKIAELAFPNTEIDLPMHLKVKTIDMYEFVYTTISLVDSYLSANTLRINRAMKGEMDNDGLQNILEIYMLKHQLLCMYGPFNNQLLELMNYELGIEKISNILINRMMREYVLESYIKNYEYAIQWIIAAMRNSTRFFNETQFNESIQWIEHAKELEFLTSSKNEEIIRLFNSYEAQILGELSQYYIRNKEYEKAIDVKIKAMLMNSEHMLAIDIIDITVLFEQYLDRILENIELKEQRNDEERDRIRDKISNLLSKYYLRIIGNIHRKYKQRINTQKMISYIRGKEMEEEARRYQEYINDSKRYLKKMWLNVIERFEKIKDEQLLEFAEQNLMLVDDEIETNQ